MITDVQIGANVAALRSASKLTQSQIAQAMSRLDWLWTQKTVSAIEKGDRSLRLAEAEDLSQVLNVQVGAITAGADYTALMGAVKTCERLVGDLERVMAEYGAAREILRNEFVSTSASLTDESREMVQHYLDFEPWEH